MPRHQVCLYIENCGLPDGEATGGDCSHILLDGPDDSEPSDPVETPRHPAFQSPFARALVTSMGLDAFILNHVMMDWSHGDGSIGIMPDSPMGSILLPDEHTAFSRHEARHGLVMSRNTVIEFSQEHMLINLLPRLGWYASGEDPEGFFITSLLTQTLARGLKPGTPLEKIIDIPALADISAKVKRIDVKADGIYEIRLEAVE